MTQERVTKSLVLVEFLPNSQTPVVSSVSVAQHFGVKHKNVLRDIDILLRKVPETQTGLRFEPSSYQDSTGRTLPSYLLDRNAFTLLVMGWSSKTAIQWKLRYIAAFNALEQAALQSARAKALAEGYALRTRMTPERLQLIRRALGYHARGFSQRETGKMLDCTHTTVGGLLKDAVRMGLLEEAGGA